ncbi:MAG: hypothetical protein HUU15_17260 [Candidatus Brocadiae bacterium]|nr:hypothetical protein [Candidatus Brocadiia bacterium]
MRRLSALCLAAAALSACDKVKDIPNPLADKPGSGAPSGSGFGRNDLDAFTAAMKSQDWQKLYGLLSVEYQQQQEAEARRIQGALASSNPSEKSAAEAELKALGLEPSEFVSGDPKSLGMRLAGAKASRAKWPTDIRETKSIKADESKAEVVYVDSAGTEGTLRFTKQNGVWRIVP